VAQVFGDVEQGRLMHATCVGDDVGANVGKNVVCVGPDVGADVGKNVAIVGDTVGTNVGAALGAADVGTCVGLSVTQQSLHWVQPTRLK
jgi:hypothetical protein